MDPGPVHVRLDRLVDDVARGRLLPGVERCVLRVEGPSVGGIWTGAAGLADPGSGRALHPGDCFRAASVTKMVTATAVLRLCDAGSCGLDDPIGVFLPAALVDRVRVLDGVSHGPGITVRQLLEHTSGLHDHFGHPAVWEAIRNGGARRRFTPLELVDVAVEGVPSFAPGAGREYTDTGFVLAGLLIEAVTGQALENAYRALVFDRLGMDQTWLESSADPPRCGGVSHHVLEGIDITGMDPTVDWAGGGLVTTCGDLARLVAALRAGSLLSEAAWQEMTRWKPGPEGFYDDYGLGLGRYRIDAVQLIGHHGIWGAFAFWAVERDMVITGTVNTARADRRALLAAVLAAVAG